MAACCADRLMRENLGTWGVCKRMSLVPGATQYAHACRKVLGMRKGPAIIASPSRSPPARINAAFTA